MLARTGPLSATIDTHSGTTTNGNNVVHTEHIRVNCMYFRRLIHLLLYFVRNDCAQSITEYNVVQNCQNRAERLSEDSSGAHSATVGCAVAHIQWPHSLANIAATEQKFCAGTGLAAREGSPLPAPRILGVCWYLRQYRHCECVEQTTALPVQQLTEQRIRFEHTHTTANRASQRTETAPLCLPSLALPVLPVLALVAGRPSVTCPPFRPLVRLSNQLTFVSILSCDVC